jgi:DNA-binding CsgD family transcriptional regulator
MNTLYACRQECCVERAVLDALELAVIGITRYGEITYVNSLGSSLLANRKVLMANGPFMEWAGAGGERLRDALAAVIRTGEARSVVLADRVYATVLAPRGGRCDIPDSPAEVVVLIEAARRRVASVQQLVQLFGFTQAEAQVVRALANGENVAAYASRRGVAHSTVRSQVREALLKVGLRRQVDLVTLVRSVPPFRKTTAAAKSSTGCGQEGLGGNQAL